MAPLNVAACYIDRMTAISRLVLLSSSSGMLISALRGDSPLNCDMIASVAARNVDRR